MPPNRRLPNQTPEYVYRDDLSNPAYQDAEKEPTSLLSLAGEFLKIGIGMVLLNKAAGKTTNAVFKRLARNKTLGDKILRGAGKRAAEFYRSTNQITTSGFFRGVAHTAAEYKGIAGSPAWMKALSTAGTLGVNLGKVARNTYAQLQTSKVIGAKRLAGFARQIVKSAPGALSFYAVARPLGVIGHDEDLPAWYNMPGHVGELAKLTMEFAVFDKVIHGLAPAFRGIKKRVGGLVRKHFNIKAEPHLHEMADKYLAIRRSPDGQSARAGTFIKQVISGAARLQQYRKFAHTGSREVGRAVARLWGRAGERAAQYAPGEDLLSLKFWRRTKERALSESVGEYTTRMSRLMDNPNNARDVLNTMTHMVSSYHKINPAELNSITAGKAWGRMTQHLTDTNQFKSLFDGKTGGFMDQFHEYILRENKRIGDQFGRGKILGRTLARAKDILTDSEKDLSSRLFRHMHGLAKGIPEANKQIANVQKAFDNMYAGKGIYKSQSGIIDYSMYSPRNIFKAAVDFATPFFTIPYGKGRELPILQVLGIHTMLGRKGLAMRSIGMEEEQYFRKLVDGKPDRGWTRVSMGGSFGAPETHGVGGMFLDGKLYVTQGGTRPLELIATPQLKMVARYPYSRYSQLHRARADLSSKLPKLYADAAERTMYEHKTPGFGMKRLASKFVDKMGLQKPYLLDKIGRGAQNFFGIGPRTTIFKDAMEIMMNPKKAEDALPNDFSMLLNNFIPMGENASRNLFFTLSDPKVLRKIAKTQKVSSLTNVRKRFESLADIIEHGKGDKEFMKLMRDTYSSIDDHEIKYALDSFYKSNTANLNEAAGMGVGFGRWQLNRRQELMRSYIVDAMGFTFKMGPGEPGGMTYNAAKEMLTNNDILKHFSKKEVGSLKLISTMVDLQNGGHIGRQMFQGVTSMTATKSKAAEIIASHFKNEEQVLLQHLHRSPLSKGQGGFLSMYGDYFEEQYDRVLRGLRGQFQDDRFGGITTPMTLVEKGKFGVDLKLGMNALVDRMLGMSNWFGLRYGFNQKVDGMVKLPHFLPKIGGTEVELGGPLKTLARRTAQGVGVMAALQAMDVFADANPIFAGTMLDEGIYVPAAEVGIKSALAFHKMKDLTGITDVSKYMEGLMPGSTSTLPGAVFGGMMWGPLGVPLGMIANSFLGKTMLPEMDKSYEEMQDIYSGRELVPVRKGRFWAFSKGDYEGERVMYWRPHWFPRLKSQYKYTESLYGSKLESFIHKPWAGVGYNPFWLLPGVDKYHYEKKHYYSRPYAQTSPAFHDMPFIGPVMSATLGRLPIVGKPIKRMHQEEMEHYYSTKGTQRDFGDLATPAITAPNYTEDLLRMKAARNPYGTAARELRGDTLPILNPYGVGTMLGEQVYNFTELVGLRGFQTEAVLGGHPYDNALRHSTPKEMWSTRRAFWDKNLGDIFFSTEFFRRFVPREKKIWEKVNPLRNRMPGWLPGDFEEDYYINFLYGDPYTKIPEGEIRLPGPGYTSAYDVRNTFPGRASSLGKQVKDTVQWMVGLRPPTTMSQEEVMEEGSHLHKIIQENLLSANVAIKSEAMVYDARNDIAGYIDLVMKDYTQSGSVRPVEIKTVNNKKFVKLTQPIPSHVSQLNFYIKMLQAGPVGTILYVNRDDPEQIKTFDIRYSNELFRRDLQNLQKARQISAGIIANGKGFEDGASYSWFDRFRILADVAPSSKQYKMAAKIVNTQKKAGLLTESQIDEMRKIKKHRQTIFRKYDLYPTRFRGRVFNPDINYELMSLNDNIKAAAEYNVVERGIGSLWERFTQMNTPVHGKLWNYRTPLQHYQRTRLYGAEMSFWTKPYQDIVAPMFRQAVAADNPYDAATSFGWIGLVGFPFGTGGGLLGAAAGSMGGALYGAARSVIGGDAWIPEAVRRKREIDRAFDELKHHRALNLFQITGDEKYLTEAEHTMYKIRNKDYRAHMGTIMRSTYYAEKPFITAFLRERNEDDREKILQSVPQDVAQILRRQWAIRDKGTVERVTDRDRPEPYFEGIPRIGWEGFGEGKQLEDIKIKTAMEEGIDAHDFGLGWYDDMRRIENSPYRIEPIDIDNPDVTFAPKNMDVDGLRSALQASLSKFTWKPLVYIGFTPGGTDESKVQLNVTRDRRREFSVMLRGY